MIFLENKLNAQLHPLFQKVLSPWIAAHQAYDLAAEARQRIEDGEHGSRLVHILRRPDGEICGLSTSLHCETDLSGYTERYRSLNYFAGTTQ